MSIDPTLIAAIVFKAAKSAGLTAAALGGLVVAQTESLPELVGNLGLVALLAVLVGRYTFRQLEDYRQDLKAARARGDHLEEELEAERANSRRLEVRVHDLEDYAHRLNVFVTAEALADAPELPPEPASSS